MENLQDAARRERTAPPVGSPFGWWQVPTKGVDTDLEDGEVTLQGEGIGTQQATTVACRHPSDRGC